MSVGNELAVPRTPLDPGRRSFISATYDRRAGTVTPSQEGSSHWLTSLARANALIIVPEAVINLAAGERPICLNCRHNPVPGPQCVAGDCPRVRAVRDWGPAAAYAGY